MPRFCKPSYWQRRFASEASFEWLASSAEFMGILAPYLHPAARILHLGPGTSDLHNHLREGGFSHVTNIDYEPLAIERGQRAERDRFGDVRMKYLVADATRLDLHERYQIAIDKSTADAVSCGEAHSLASMAQGIRRCLSDDGLWVSLSFSPFRFEHATVQSLFEVEVICKLPTPKARPTDPDIFHYCYLLRPKQRDTGRVD
ncbi:hypothetical protein BT67DRAFT_448845 [Trichocladium antarcticum]|uniref:Methyltransferase type 11 domain-containing protein n=1 Tax=Trichocladium antarcticum TaxID=1450529 RepID=A0AAN6UNI0_9PEZI|nr:hypothetical protein BT67DRAFT_448845 [Trichocladium antarcticum]